ncbi:tetratricopeptide repeat protein [Saccharopolyspora sp. NPDC049426]|uniref:ATP-binding protein n=1 Tax=Saccharopolyspora sp. NPDC049426 TaxID=3155652 RepID=UPI0034206EA5
MSTSRQTVTQKHIRAGRDVVANQSIHHHYGMLPQALETLPTVPDAFTGRDSDLQRLLEALDPTTEAVGGGVVISAVAGMGGVGKTALATVAAHTARTRGWFSSVLFIDLHGYTPEAAPIDPEHALETLLRDMGISAVHIPPTLDQRAKLYRSRLQEIAKERAGPVLIVADNAAEVEQVEPLLPGRGCHRLLITSRSHLDLLQAAVRVDLDVLSRDAARYLLKEVLTASNPVDARVDDNEGLGRIADACGFLPLALRICAARLSRSPRVTPTRLADQLDDRVRRLDRLDLGNKRRAVRAAFDVSFERLSAEQAEVFVLLALNPGPSLSTAAAAVLAGKDVDEVGEVLDELAAAHLLRPDAVDAGRWAMHDLLADYALHRLAEPQFSSIAPRRAHRRLLVYYNQMAYHADQHVRVESAPRTSNAFNGREEALAWFDAERANLVAAAHAAADAGHADIAFGLPTSMSELLQILRYFDDWVAVSYVAYKVAYPAGGYLCEAKASDNLGAALSGVDQFEKAIEAHQRAIYLYHMIGDSGGEARAWNNCGGALLAMGNAEKAIDSHRRALDIRQRIGDRYGQARAWNNLGACQMALGNFEDSIQSHNHAIALYKEAGDGLRYARAWTNLGIAHHAAGKHEESVKLLKRAVVLCRQEKSRYFEVYALIKLGCALVSAGRLKAGEKKLNTAVELAKKIEANDLLRIADEGLREIRTESSKEASVSDVIGSLTPELQEVFVAVLDEHDNDLLNSLRASSEPSQDEREAVEDILSDAFSEHIDHDGEPTERGRLIDDALGKFLLRWPIDG